MLLNCGAESTDDDCGLGLVCFERDDETPVPGCVGDGVWGFDYCYRPPAIVEYVGDYEMGYYELGNCQSGKNNVMQYVSTLSAERSI